MVMNTTEVLKEYDTQIHELTADLNNLRSFLGSTEPGSSQHKTINIQIKQTTRKLNTVVENKKHFLRYFIK
jgi:hypothetical protein